MCKNHLEVSGLNTKNMRQEDWNFSLCYFLKLRQWTYFEGSGSINGDHLLGIFKISYKFLCQLNVVGSSGCSIRLVEMCAS